MALPNPSMSFSPFAILTAAEMNDLVENIESLAAGTGINNGVITAPKINFGGAGSGIWWEEIGRATLSSSSISMSVSSIVPKKFMRVLISGSITGGTYGLGIRFNNDSSANYSYLIIYNNSPAANYVALGTQNLIQASTTVINGGTVSFDALLNNPTTSNKLISMTSVAEIGGGTSGFAPAIEIYSGKWVNSVSQVNRVDIVRNTGTGNLAAGTSLIILGHD